MRVIILLIVVLCSVIANPVCSQNKTFGKKAFFSTSYKRAYSLRRGLNIGVQGDLNGNIFASLGYGQATWDAVNKRIVYFSVSGSGQVYPMDKENFKWGLEGSGYLNYIGRKTLSPFVYGGTIQFVKEIEQAELNLRPEIGISFPNKFKNNVDRPVKAMVYIIYGFNVPVIHHSFGYANNILSVKLLLCFKSWLEY